MGVPGPRQATLIAFEITERRVSMAMQLFEVAPTDLAWDTRVSFE